MHERYHTIYKVPLRCDLHDMTVAFLIQEQLDEERAMMKKMIDQQPIKAMSSLSRSSISIMIALSVSSLLVMTGCVFYYQPHPHPLHYHRQLIDNFVTKDLQSPSSLYSPSKDTAASSSSTLKMTSSNDNISPLERQALQDLYHSTDGPTVVPTNSLLTVVPTLVPLSSPSSNNNNIPPLERQALQDLYDSTDGPNWNIPSQYHEDFSNPNANLCDLWLTFQCSSDYHIIGLDLYYSNLIGSIPSTIGQLSSLEGLYLHANQLIGTIPSTIGQLSSLRNLDLSYNQLIGTIPSIIGQLSFLQRLDLSFNQLIGSIPSTIGQLYSLQYLNLNGNLLIGTIPSTIGQLSSLLDLYLNGNLLIGTIPSTIGQLFSLGGLDLGYNQLTGTIPSIIDQLSSLRELYLGNNKLIGAIPSSIGQLSSLQYLDLNDNQLTGVVPASLCQLSVHDMYFQNNPFQCYPECLLSLPNVWVQYLSPLCSYSLERQALQDLYDSTDGPNWKISNYLFGSGIPWDFSNPDANPCFDEWHGVTCSLDYHVIELNLYGSNLRGTIPLTIGQLSYLKILYLHSNLLIGTYPSTIRQLSHLQELQLSYNQLIGTIPSSIGTSSLYYLDLSNNKLTGTIPPTIGQFPSALRWLDLGSNRLTGVVPASLCQSIVTVFNFQNNPLQCYPECLLHFAQQFVAGSTPVCASDQPTAEPTGSSAEPTAGPSDPSAQPTMNMGE